MTSAIFGMDAQPAFVPTSRMIWATSITVISGKVLMKVAVAEK